MDRGGTLGDLIVNWDSVKVLEFLTDLPDGDFSKTDLMRETGISFRKMQEIVKPLETLGIIVPTRTIARAQLYKLDKNNGVFKALMNFEYKLAKAFIAIELANEEQT
jgi:predicted transcriptional regulator